MIRFLDLSTEFLFGQSIDAQLPDDSNNSKELLKAFNGALAGVGKRRLAGKLQFIYSFESSWKRDIGTVYANPEIWTQLRAESIGLGDHPLTFESLKSLRSFRNVLQETLRLQGPAGRSQRLALKNTILPAGGGPDGKSPVFVEQGNVVALNIWGPNHDKDISTNIRIHRGADDVDEFKPQRFSDKTMGWEFTPFLSGPRICPAQQ
ncbi:hypothetical protein BHYA_0027g00600 [Botrytis hyacinthi]|uniref:Cytochrome P450 n=1 Tax=Botrytis hyacinthi TaxID=278943 RepID=A0A4Z1H0C7_9HELO|nr:hypothetical protein BHYA_0027g00600 [Botrytis hyacinthi]